MVLQEDEQNWQNLTKLIKKRREKIQITNSGIKRDNTTDLREIKRIIRNSMNNFCQQIGNLDEINQFLQIHKL